MSEVDLGWSALTELAVISVACAVGALLVFRRFSDQQGIARAKNRAEAHLLEFRLFMDDPVLVLRAQRDLLFDQLRLLSLLVRPLLVLALPMILLLGQLEALFGRTPLRPGEPAVVTVKLDRLSDTVSLEAPPAVSVETPPVRVEGGKEVSWRIRALAPFSGVLRIRVGNKVFAKTVRAGWGMGYTSERRPGSWPSFVLHPTELPCAGVAWIRIGYPLAAVLGFSWLLWFLLISTIAAFLLRPFLGVAA